MYHWSIVIFEFSWVDRLRNSNNYKIISGFIFWSLKTDWEFSKQILYSLMSVNNHASWQVVETKRKTSRKIISKIIKREISCNDWLGTPKFRIQKTWNITMVSTVKVMAKEWDFAIKILVVSNVPAAIPAGKNKTSNAIKSVKRLLIALKIFEK